MKFAKKSLGQNFLIDKNVLKKIVNIVKIKNRHVIEVGPGKGALTDEILKGKPKSLSIIEKDYILAGELRSKYKDYNNIKIYTADILKFDLEKIDRNDSIIFGNLPYNISSQILVKILKFNKWPPKFKDIIFMFQKELAEKILGKFSTLNYGRLSILSNYRLRPDKKFLVSPNSFYPKPKVLSQVIHFTPKNSISFKIKNLNNLEKVTNILFSNKRKMINKNIKKILDSKKIKKVGNLKLNLRPSELAPHIYYKITEIYEKE